MGNYLVLLLLILLGYGKAAIVRISSPNSEVNLGANITFKVIDVSPNISSHRFDRLDCGIMLPGDSSYKIIVAQYDKHSLHFKTPSQGIPKRFRGRVSYVGEMSFVIHRIQFEDKSLKVVCIMNYKNGSLTSHVESQAYEIKMVYVNPMFQSNSTSEGIVKIAYGQNSRIQCIVSSWPPSRIHWISSIISSNFEITNSTSGGKTVVAVTSTFMLKSPSFHFDGKNVTCVAIPMHGSSIKREFTLSYANVTPTFHENSTPQGTVKIAYGQKTKIQCIAVSWPPSKLDWEINISKSEYVFKDLTSEYNGAALVKKTLILNYPSFRLDGQKVACVVTSKYGKVLRREFKLSYINVNPTFQASSTPEGKVVIEPGQMKKLLCIVTSWPQSRITWESDISSNEFKVIDSTSEYNGIVEVKSVFTLQSPSASNHGKKVTCVSTLSKQSKHGNDLRREFTLSYKNGVTPDINDNKPNSSANGRKHLIVTIALCGIFSLVVNMPNLRYG